MNNTLTVLACIQRVEDRIVGAMAYFCGALFLLLAFYTTFDVIGRRYLGIFSGVTDEMSEYALAIGASWALAYTLKAGGHVRVDILLDKFTPPARRLADALAMVVMAVFSATVAFFLWKLVAASFAIGATGHSIIQTPQWIPQACAALGYSFLTLVSLTGLASQLLCSSSPSSS